jgi:hypothetical protein
MNRVLKWVTYVLLVPGVLALLVALVIIPIDWVITLHRDPTANPIGLVFAFISLFGFGLGTSLLGLLVALLYKAAVGRQHRRAIAAASVDGEPPPR